MNDITPKEAIEILSNYTDLGYGVVIEGEDTSKIKQALSFASKTLASGTPLYINVPSANCVSREVINSEIEKRYCSKHCVVPSEEPYCPDNCPARFLKNIVKECPPVPQVTVFTENADGKAVADLKAELQSVVGARSKGEWIYHDKLNMYYCKDCGLLEPFTKEEIEEGIKLPNFCQQCGADMRKGGAE